MKEWLVCCMDVCSSYKHGSDIGLERLSYESKIISNQNYFKSKFIIEGESETCLISEIAIIILSLKFIGSFETATFSFTNLFFFSRLAPSVCFLAIVSFVAFPILLQLLKEKRNEQQKEILSDLSAMRNTRFG